jgi:single-strand DNA-binding protein
MASINKVMLIGNLGKDPETRHFEGGGMLVKFPIATTETYKNRQGERVSHTEWHNIVVSKKGLTDICDRYLKKGMQVFVEGKIRTRQWEDNGITRYMQEINIDNMVMMSGSTNPADAQEAKPTYGQAGMARPEDSPVNAPAPATPGTEDDDLPF